MGRIIINYDNEISEKDAIRRVAAVVLGGRVSKHMGKDCYCLASTFDDGSVVLASLTRTGNDVFTVYGEK
jgi:hypothetical protein